MGKPHKTLPTLDHTVINAEPEISGDRYMGFYADSKWEWNFIRKPDKHEFDLWSLDVITEPTIKVALACLVMLSVCLPGCNSSPSSPSMTGLPRIDKAELFKLKKHGDLWNGEIERETSLVGNEAQDVARLWRAQSFSSDSPICHNPGYAIKFYDRDVQIVYATLCWECDNIEFLTPQLDKYVGFDAQGAKGQELLKYLKDRLEAQSSVVSMRRTLDAAERASAVFK